MFPLDWFYWAYLPLMRRDWLAFTALGGGRLGALLNSGEKIRRVGAYIANLIFWQ